MQVHIHNIITYSYTKWYIVKNAFSGLQCWKSLHLYRDLPSEQKTGGSGAREKINA